MSETEDQPWTSITSVAVASIPFPEHFSGFLDRQIATQTVHEQDFLYLKNYDPRGLLVLDAGANIGQAAISCEIAAPGCRIIGFEPNVSLMPLQARAGEFCTRFHCESFGLAETGGVGRLYIPVVAGKHISGESSMLLDHFKDPTVANRLRSYSADRSFSLDACEFAFKRLDEVGDVFECAQAAEKVFFKIDVEGAEAGVLWGAAKFILTFSPMIMVENGERTEIVSILQHMGYSRHLRAPDNTLVPAGDRHALNSFFVPGTV